MKIMTIGFTKTTAKHFFERLLQAGVKRVIDVRLNNTSQLAGFAKAADLSYFLETIGGIGYVHQPLLAPTQEIMDAFKKEKGAWADNEPRFLALMEGRKVDKSLDPALFEDACLLCSEAEPKNCHRRLVAEYLASKWPSVTIRHL